MLRLLTLLLPLSEILAFVLVGELIGYGSAVLLLLLAAAAGIAVILVMGRVGLRQIQAALAAGVAPVDEMLRGGAILLAGALLIVPGFLSDLAALALLFGPLRRRFGRRLWDQAARQPGFKRRAGPTVIEGEYEVVPPEQIGRGWDKR